MDYSALGRLMPHSSEVATRGKAPHRWRTTLRSGNERRGFACRYVDDRRHSRERGKPVKTTLYLKFHPSGDGDGATPARRGERALDAMSGSPGRTPGPVQPDRPLRAPTRGGEPVRDRGWRQGLETGVGDRGWRQGLETGVGDRGWRQGLETGVGDRGWRQGLETGAGDRGWRQGLETGVGDRGWRQGLETGAGDRGYTSGLNRMRCRTSSGSNGRTSFANCTRCGRNTD